MVLTISAFELILAFTLLSIVSDVCELSERISNEYEKVLKRFDTILSEKTKP